MDRATMPDTSTQAIQMLRSSTGYAYMAGYLGQAYILSSECDLIQGDEIFDISGVGMVLPQGDPLNYQLSRK